MPEKFTNICGGSFLPFVAKQIEVRKKFLEESNVKRENKHLVYLNNKNAWFRLTSCTDVSQDHLLYKKYDLSGDALARKYILQGGTVSLEGKNIVHRHGVGQDGLYGMLPNKPLGPKPMPGITSVDLSSAGRLGTLQYATIKFKCHDLEQLEIMDALYMKLGFSLVLEWGHTIYLDENSDLKNPTPLNVFDHRTKENLVKAIQRKRVSHNANYDAMLGTVSNFGWETNPNGSYDCEIKLVGAGDILESLKINQACNKSTNFTKTDDSKEVTSQIADKDLSLLNQALFSIHQQVLNYTSTKGNGIRLVGTKTESYRKVLNKIYSSCPYEFIKFDKDGHLVGDDIALRGNQFSLISDLNKNNGGSEVTIPYNDTSLFHSISVPYQINDGSSKGTDQVYITLGHLLALITATGMLYNTTSLKDGKPYIYIDFNDKLNFCSTFKGQVSLDPRICLVPRNQSNNEDPFGIGKIEDVLFNSIGGVITKKQYVSPPQSVGIAGGGSAVINTQQNIVGEVRPAGFVNNYLNVSSEEKDVRARLMYILVNVNYITDTLKSLREKDSKGVVNFSDFMNTLLDGISKSLGGFNDFRLLVDDSNKCVRIIDDNTTLLPKESSSEEQYTEIPLFGEKSIAYNYKFKSKIGPKMASMVTIAAQANPSSLGDDVFAISNLSRGLSDRVNTERTPANLTNFSSSLQDPINGDSIKTLKQHIQNVLGANGSFIINSNSVDPSLNTYKELLSEFRTKIDPINKASIIIPLTFEVELDGLSGIIPNSAFVIPTNLLPVSYKTKDDKHKVAFIIHQINQNFNNNKWTTYISGQTKKIRFDPEDNKTITDYGQKSGQTFNEVLLGEDYTPQPLPKNIVETNKNLTKLKNIIGVNESNNNYGVANIGGSGQRSLINVNGLTFDILRKQQNISDDTNRQRVFAAGRFQIIPDTMDILTKKLGLKGSDRYDPKTQEKMGDYLLLTNRPQIGNYIKGSNGGSSNDLSSAINQIGYEWASMPVVRKSSGPVVGNVIDGTGQTGNYGSSGSNPNKAKVSVKTMVNILIQTRIAYSGKPPSYMPKYYNPML